MTDIPPVARAALAFVRGLDAEQLEAVAGNPLRSFDDAALWTYVRCLDPGRLGLLLIDAVEHAGHHGVSLPLDAQLMAVWAAEEAWNRAAFDEMPDSLAELGQAMATGRWTR